VIPKSAPVLPSYVAPRSRAELRNQIQRFLGSRDKILPYSFLKACESLLPKCEARDIRRLVILSQKYAVKDPDLKKAILDRIIALGPTCPLKVMLAVQNRFRTKQLPELINSRPSLSLDIPELCDTDLISLIPMSEPVTLRIVNSEVLRRLPSLSEYSIATIINEFKKKKSQVSPSPHLIDAMTAEITRRLESMTGFSCRDLALILNGYSSLSSQSLLIPRISDHIVSTRSPESFDSIQIPMILHATTDARLIDFFASEIIRTITNYKTNDSVGPKGVAMILYAMGKSRFHHNELLSVFSTFVRKDVQNFDMRSLALSCYGFGRLRHVPDSLVAVVGTELVFRALVKPNSKPNKRYTLGDIGMISNFFKISQFTKEMPKYKFSLFMMFKNRWKEMDQLADVPVGSLLSLLSRHGSSDYPRMNYWVSKILFQEIPRMAPSELLNVTQSLLRLNVQNGPLFAALSTAIDPGVINFKQLPRMVYLVGKLSGEKNVKFEKIPQIARLVSAHLPEYTVVELSQLLYGFSELMYRNQNLISRAEQCLVVQLDGTEMSPVTLSQLLLALSRLRSTNHVVFDSILKRVFENIHAFAPQEKALCNVLFACAASVGSGDITAGQLAWLRSVVQNLLIAADRSFKKIPVEGIRQLQTVKLWIDMQPDLVGKRAGILEKVMGVDTYACAQPSIEQSSKTHREISRYLSVLGKPHTNENVIGPFTTDILITDTKTVIEIDGPHHFFENSTIRTSASVLKHNLLEHLGYTVVHAPFHEWAQCTSDAKKLAYSADLVGGRI
jgi:hypothetical protein